MTSLARRIVSAGKRRFQDADTGVDLDLAYITDRILIMGWPATGLESLYRNSLTDVLKFLEARHGRKWRIFNFCPRVENEYPSSAVYGQVRRFPFPDHHAPPLSLIPLLTRAMRNWLESDPDNVAVIHCKAGKGRSGTMVCCYLLSLPTLPRPPQLDCNLTPSQRLTPTSSRASSIISSDAASQQPDRKGTGDAMRDGKGKERAEQLVAALRASASREGMKTEQAGAPATTNGTDNGTDGDFTEVEGETDQQAQDGAAAEALEIADRLTHVFQLHTDQRMEKPKVGKYGISIASQRRWVSYWARILEGDDPRPWLSEDACRGDITAPRPKRRAELLRVTLHMADKLKSLPPPLSGKRVSVSVSRYADAYVDGLEERERQLRARSLAGKEGNEVEAEQEWNDDDWPDRHDLIERGSVFVQASHDAADDALGDLGVRNLVPKGDEPFEIDPDRQILLKILIGKSGSKHSMLPDVASLGYAWTLLSFEATLPPSDTTEQTWAIGAGDVDFLKAQAGLKKLELTWRWLP